MRIEQSYFVIRNAEKSDSAQLAEWWNDGRMMAHAGFPLGLNITAEEIEKKISEDRDETGRRLIIEFAGKPIGEMNYRNVGDETAEIGIKICERNCQNRGIGRIVLSLLIRELFEMGYEKIVLDTNLNNLRAQHVYELLGFRKVRVRENSWKDQLGDLQSAVDYELVPEDFADHAANLSWNPEML